MDLNKEDILRRWYIYVDLVEREWTMMPDGEIVKIPNDETAKAYCKVLLDLYKEIAPYRDELMRDFVANPDDEFLQKCVNGIFKDYLDLKPLIDIFHLDDEPLALDGIMIPIEYRSDFVFLFGNSDHLAKSFLKELYDVKEKNGKVKPKDVVHYYKKYHGRLNDNDGNYMVLFNVIAKDGLGLFLKSYPTLTRAFRKKS